jgi:hypothetical protein
VEKSKNAGTQDAAKMRPERALLIEAAKTREDHCEVRRLDAMQEGHRTQVAAEAPNWRGIVKIKAR